tara:strand:- start:5395 stop:6108 length:714 start_codon:yes stop_codon:yes gene_type:complete
MPVDISYGQLVVITGVDVNNNVIEASQHAVAYATANGMLLKEPITGLSAETFSFSDDVDVSDNLTVGGNIDISGQLSVGNGTTPPTSITAQSSNCAIALKGHIIPSANAQYDLGNAEYKIRHLFLSDNSLWIGDDHKIDVSGGDMKFKKRNKTHVPEAILEAGGDEAAALNHAGVGSLSEMTLSKWKNYAKTLNIGGGIGKAEIEDIFRKDKSEDWQADDDILARIKALEERVAALE